MSVDEQSEAITWLLGLDLCYEHVTANSAVSEPLVLYKYLLLHVFTRSAMSDAR